MAEESTTGIGEIGLDYICIDSKLHWQKQQDLLRKLIDFTHTCELPVIIHCSSSDVPGDEDAMHNCIQILASHLEKCYPVYVHCFNGSIQEHQMWLSHFPNAHFGISPLVLDSSHRHPELKGIIRKMDVVQLLLESDALYFRDPDSHQLGTSHLVCQIAELISQVHLVPTSTVLKEAPGYLKFLQNLSTTRTNVHMFLPLETLMEVLFWRFLQFGPIATCTVMLWSTFGGQLQLSWILRL